MCSERRLELLRGRVVAGISYAEEEVTEMNLLAKFRNGEWNMICKKHGAWVKEARILTKIKKKQS
jgi:hypothetical protein